MIHELTPSAFSEARPLFAGLEPFQVSVGAVLDGECEGRLFVDDATRPRSALLTSPEGCFLAGEPDNTAFNAALRRFVWDALFAQDGWEMLFVTVDSAHWRDRLSEMAAPRELLRVERRHFTCDASPIDWRARVPRGFVVRQVDDQLLDATDLEIPDHLHGWIANNWGTRERFRARGFGFATVGDGAVASWSLADGRSGDACEIGIQTHYAYRRRGLATVTAAAAVEHALASGFRTVGWHANDDNAASIATAGRIGFRYDRRYSSLYFYATEAEEMAERGWVAFRAGRHDETAALLARAFELRPDSPDFQYLLAARAHAALGDTESSVQHLNRAIDRGWSDADAAKACPEFAAMHDDPGWQSALARMARAS